MKRAQTSIEGRAQVEKLVQKFTKNIDHYRSQAFGETATRNQFIDPFWAALGWDVADADGLGPDRDVLVELHYSTTTTTAGEDDWDEDVSDEELAERVIRSGFPDYVFRINTQNRFLCEAKRPSVSLRTKGPVFQAKSYGYTLGITLAVLSDFEEFRVFDARWKPDLAKPDAGIVPGMDLSFKDYLDHWDDIWDLLSHDAVSGGSLTSYAQKSATKGSTPVGQAFLADLSRWRQKIAEDLLKRNANVTWWQLAEATQRILDRVVFIRAMEDKGVLSSLVLRAFARTTDSYSKLVPEFHRLDAIYNGALFAPHFSEQMDLGDAVLQPLIASLYPPQSPYRFDVIDTDLLGKVYEQFLGQQITISGSKVKIEDKPEVRHAGGVYYTPKWVVNRIISETIAPLVEGKTPVAVANLRIVDPSCGSGAFLLGALEFLIRWHEDYYEAHPTETPERHYVAPNGERRLTADEKGRIAANNLFGVDIDPQACEVTMMSLYLAILEGENINTLQTQQRLFVAAYLPKLDTNIKCGNSLLDNADLGKGKLFTDQDLLRRINAFDWDGNAGFADVFNKRGGFDAVIGNPPYIRAQELVKFRPEETKLYASKYGSGEVGSWDIASLFVEHGLALLRSDGRFGYIITRQFCETDSGETLRKLLATGRNLKEIIDFHHGFVFEKFGGSGPVNAYTMLLFLTKKARKNWQLTRVPAPPTPDTVKAAQATNSILTATIPTKSLNKEPWDLLLPAEEDLLKRMAKAHPDLGTVSGGVIGQGVPTGADYVFWVEDVGPVPGDKTLRRVRTRPRGKQPRFDGVIEKDLLRPVWHGSVDISRFHVEASSTWLIMPYNTGAKVGGKKATTYQLYDKATLTSQYPHALDWFKVNMTELMKRKAPEKKPWTTDNFWGYSRPQNLALFDEPKIWVPYLVNHLCATFDPVNHAMVNVATGGYAMPEASLTDDADWVVALLNSALLSWALQCYSRAFAGNWFAARKGNLVRLPIADPDDKTRKAILDLYDKCVTARAAEDYPKLGKAAAKFDDAVYDLYKISQAERVVIRSSF